MSEDAVFLSPLFRMQVSSCLVAKTKKATTTTTKKKKKKSMRTGCAEDWVWVLGRIRRQWGIVFRCWAVSVGSGV